MHPDNGTISWTRWSLLDPPINLTQATLTEILDGGQAFRWNRQLDGSWLGIWDQNIFRLRTNDADQIEWSTPAGTSSNAPDHTPLLRYLAIERDWDHLSDQLPWRTDRHLETCRKAFPGLRVLRQPFGETLLCFLCSATKQIVQIKQMAETLATNLGRSLAPGFSALPTWETLARADESKLRSCALGFRARYIRATAMILAEQPGWLEETEGLPYDEAKSRLVSLPGVGEKVADCVLLFGAGRLEAFPVDTWILKVLENRYQLRNWNHQQLVRFGQIHFGPLAGLAQQYLFAFERRFGGRTRASEK